MPSEHENKGNIGQDCTEAILAMVPRREDAAGTSIPADWDSPVPEWSGPTDDLELLSKMFNARGSAAGLLGQRATFADLWYGDAAVLARFFPSVSGDAFDRSDADAALVMHLAFWTGKHGARIERLWRMSPLAAGQPKLAGKK